MIKSLLLYVLNYFPSPGQAHYTPFSRYPNGPLGLVMHINRVIHLDKVNSPKVHPWTAGPMHSASYVSLVNLDLVLA